VQNQRLCIVYGELYAVENRLEKGLILKKVSSGDAAGGGLQRHAAPGQPWTPAFQRHAASGLQPFFLHSNFYFLSIPIGA